METTKAPAGGPIEGSESPVEWPPPRPEAIRRARFQNLIWREATARSTHLIRAQSGGPTPAQPDVPVEWLKELDHR